MSKWYLLFVLSSILTHCGTSEEKIPNKDTTVKVDPSKVPLSSGKTLNIRPNTVGAKDGDFIEKWPNGNIRFKGQLVGGMRQGHWESYFQNGNKQSECDFYNDKSNGKVATYRPNGTIIYLGYYSNGLPTGKWLWMDEKGNVIKEMEYKK